MNRSSRKSVVTPRRAYVGAQPFEGDQLLRKSFAEFLTEQIGDFAPDGGVIVLDAEWGAGKTWFAQNWCAHLKATGYRSHYVDCFARDYMEDSFLLIASEIIDLLPKNEKGETLKETALKVSKAIAPALLRGSGVILNAIVPGLGGALNAETAQKLTDALSDAGDRAIDKYLEAQIENAHSNHRTVEHFRNALSAMASAETKPVVLIVDELDRCNPHFAVKTIERLKHFFEVPNLVVVLVTSIGQLEAYVNGVYGSNVDSARYLRKFYKRVFGLPEQVRNQSTSYTYALERLHACQGLQQTGSIAEAWEELGVQGGYLTLRDIEHAVTILSTIDPHSWEYACAPMLIYLKLRQTAVYRAIQEGNASDVTVHHYRHITARAAKAVDGAGAQEFLLRPFLMGLMSLRGWTTNLFTANELDMLTKMEASQYGPGGKWQNQIKYFSKAMSYVEAKVYV